MEIFKQTVKVNLNRLQSIEIPEEFGDEVEIIVRKVKRPNDSDFPIEFHSGEELMFGMGSGFLNEILKDPKEDIWNDV